MKIELKNLKLNNFKKQNNINIEFTSRTSISGDNECGKTSIMDAYLWLLFDRDSRGNKGASACKTTDGAVFIHHLDHEVEGTLSIDGNDVVLRKVLREKWVKPQGKPDQRYDGNTVYIWKDGMELTVGQFAVWINSIGKLSLLQSLADLTFFSETLTWKERIEYLMEMSGGISKEEVAQGDKDLEALLLDLGDKDISDFKKTIQSKITKVKDTIAEIPPRISELKRGIVSYDWDELESELAISNKALKEFEKQRVDAESAMAPIIALKKELSALEYQREKLLIEKVATISKPLKQQVEESHLLESERIQTEQKLWKARNVSGEYLNDISRLEKETDGMREKAVELIERLKDLRKLDAPEMNDIFECPTCGQVLPEEEQESRRTKLLDNWNFDKSQKISTIESNLESIKSSGISNNARVEELKQLAINQEETINSLSSEIVSINEKLETIKTALSSEKRYTVVDFLQDEDVLDLDNKIKELDSRILIPERLSFLDSATKEAEIKSQIHGIESKLYARETNERTLIRIKELEEDLKNSNNNQAKLEGQIYQCDQFIKTRTTKMEGKINSMFHDVTFKLFKEQINGGIEETCEAIVNGTTFHNANTAGQINAGLDIIGALMSVYGVQMPVWVDNVNLVTKPRELNTQMIHMIVNEGMPLTISEF